MASDERVPRRGLADRLFGGTIDPGLGPVLGVSFLHAVAMSARASFMGLWALRELGSSQSALAWTFAGAALASVVAGYAGGQISDRIGRRPLILAASAAQAVIGAFLAVIGGHLLIGLALMIFAGGAEGVATAADQALLTDLVPVERHEHAFASARVAQNIGFVIGPLVGALLLTVGWRALFVATSAIGAVAFVAAIRAIPRRPMSASHTPPEEAPWRVLMRDRSFAIVLIAGTLAAIVYTSYETLLPISLVQSHGLAPAAWGLLIAINPTIVVLFQIRLTGSVRNISERVRLSLGIAAMGTPFLLLSLSTAIPLLVVLLLIFVLGEMLWGPPSLGLIARIAPADMRGAYLGASGAMWPAAFALGPLIGLQVRSSLGDTAMWVAMAIIACFAIIAYGIAADHVGRGATRTGRPVPPVS
jgi:predicted MFS family arabinose efflux permease